MEVFDVRVSFDGANPSDRDTSIFTVFPRKAATSICNWIRWCNCKATYVFVVGSRVLIDEIGFLDESR